MIDEEIEKALECCSCGNKQGCNVCPEGRNKNEVFSCTIHVSKNALDYIARLKAENARLKKNYEELCDFKRKLEDELTERGFAEYAHGDFRILSEEEKEKIQNETAKEILQELLGFIGTNQKFCVVEDNHKSLIETDGVFSKIENIAKKYGVNIEQ